MTAQEVLNEAIMLIDDVEDNSGVGQIRADGMRDYKAPYIINRLQREIARAEGVEPNHITALTDTLVISDDSAYRILPYGVAAELLLMDKQMDESINYQYKYNELFKQVGVGNENFVDDMGVIRGF